MKSHGNSPPPAFQPKNKLNTDMDTMSTDITICVHLLPYQTVTIYLSIKQIAVVGTKQMSYQYI